MATIDERLSLLQKAQGDKLLQAVLFERCKEDPVFWFNHFCWTFNPRLTGIKHIPFNLYPFQEKIVQSLCDCIDRGEPLLIEKSRDMGLSWIVMLVFHYYFMFVPGADLHVGSSKLEYVDKKGVKSTLIEKVRYNHSFQPGWLTPKLRPGKDDTFCRLINPANGNTLTGEAAVPSFGMSQRYKAVLLDEFARQPYGELAYATVSQTTNCIVMIYTPYGKSNMAYTLSHSSEVERITL